MVQVDDPVYEKVVQEYQVALAECRELHDPQDQVWAERFKWMRIVGDLLARIRAANEDH